MTKVDKIIRDPEFAKRLTEAADSNALTPPYNSGRLTWVSAQMASNFNAKVSIETVRKWFSGEAKPRPDKLRLLARMFDVDEAWLSLGIQPNLRPREQRVQNATAEGAVNVLAGFIQMGGGNPAFPEPGDKRAERHNLHLYAILKGASYAFHVALGRTDQPEVYNFTLPNTYSEAFCIGVIPTTGPGVIFVELTESIIEERGVRRGGYVEVSLGEAEVAKHRITSFDKRI